MGYINLFKINASQTSEFEKMLGDEIMIGDSKTLNSPSVKDKTYTIRFYALKNKSGDVNKELAWKWLYDEFETEPPPLSKFPKDILVITNNVDSCCYCVTFGNAFFKIDKYCERDFAFSFARKINFKETRTSTKQSPGLRRNKIISTYRDFNGLDLESSEAFAKLKVVCDLEDNFLLYRPTLSIGQSIRFETGEKRDSLFKILQLIEHVEYVLNTKKDINHLPLFREIKDTNKIQQLDDFLIQQIESEEINIFASELEVYGSTEVINNADNKYAIKFQRNRLDVNEVTVETIKEFCEKFNFPFDQNILNFHVTYYKEQNSLFTRSLKELVEAVCDKEYAVLSKGKWYEYNRDFIDFLDESMSYIDVEYVKDADLSSEVISNFQNEKFCSEKDTDRYKGMTEKEIRKSISNRYYPEMIFNLLREQEHYELLDRKTIIIQNHKVEIADLYKNDTIYAVKLGSGSEKLSYAIDQSLTSLRLRSGWPSEVKTIALWFVLDHSHIEDENGRPDLKKLQMLTLKMKIDDWSKEVIRKKLTPKVFISYLLKS